MLSSIWSFKYEPQEFSGVILNKDIKPKLEKALEEIPNLLLYGTPGVGKGTYTHIFLKQTGLDSIWINASDEIGIDVIRDKVKSFATALGVTPLKVVVFNEADSLTRGPQGAQKALKQIIEDVQKICRFIFLSNDISRMEDAITSRCQVIKIDNPPAKEIFNFANHVLKQEKVKFDNKTLLSIIKKCYPDIRKTIQAIQENTMKGKLVGDSIHASEALWRDILNCILSKDIENIRKLLRSNYVDYTELYRFLYENVGEFKEPGGAILTIGQHLVWDGTVAIKEINFMHMVFHGIWEKIW